MPIYTVQGPDGRTYEIEGPAGATAEQLGKVIMSAKKPAAPAETYDPTEGMSTFDKFAAGAGKAMYDVGRGVGQMVGLVSRDDVAESRKRDAALMNTGAGVAGNIVGNVASLVPTAFIPGANTLAGSAAIGAASGLVQPSTSTQETATNTLLGGVIAPAGIVAGRMIGAGVEGAKAVRDTFTKEGQKRIASNVLKASATNADEAANNMRNVKQLLPGSQPTAGQAAKDPGIAQLERTFLNNPEMAAALQQRYATQRAARLKTIQDVAGTDEYYNAIKQGRSVFAAEDYAKALQGDIDPAVVASMKPQIDSLLRRPSMQQAQKVAAELAAESDKSLSSAGSLEGLDWLKKALDNQISKASQPGSSIGKQELAALLQTKNDLVSTMEVLAPGYKEAAENFAAMSKQVNSMDVARDFLSKYEPVSAQYGNTAREMGNAFQKALSASTESVKKQTGMNMPLSQIMPTKDIQALENVARDLARKQYAEEAGRAVGSNTAQNLVSQNLLRRFLGPTGLPEGMADNTILQTLLRPVEFAGRAATPKIQNQLAELLLDPAMAAEALKRATPAVTVGPSSNALLRAATQPALLSGAFAANRPQQ